MGIYLGTEYLTCPKCGLAVRVHVMHDMPALDYLECPGCNYRAVLDMTPILDKYGLPHGVSRQESADIARTLPDQVSAIAQK